MSKLTLVLLIATLVVAVKGYPTLDKNLSTAAAAGNWDEVHRLLAKFYRQTNNWIQPQSAPLAQLQNVQQLQQQTQNAVQEAQQRVQQQLAQQAAQLAQQPGHFAQQSGVLANRVGGNPGTGGGRVYEESESSYSSNNNGVVHTGGHKLINDNGKVTEYDFTPRPVLV